jgi:periplasmic divalent cation tolerance protein
MLIGWTSVQNRNDADRLAAGLIEARLAACVQIDGPVVSHYRWDGHIERTEEFRLMIKFLSTRQMELEAWLQARHPYASPEWVVVRADHIAEKYLSWAQANSTSVTL